MSDLGGAVSVKDEGLKLAENGGGAFVSKEEGEKVRA
jgi:hypothetical protein